LHCLGSKPRQLGQGFDPAFIKELIISICTIPA
jgi:hypothetical protein